MSQHDDPDTPEEGATQTDPGTPEAEAAAKAAPEADAPEADAAAEGDADAAAEASAEDEAPKSKKKKRKGDKPKGGKKKKAAEKEKPAWPPPPPERLEGAIEAVLMVAGDVVRLERLRDLLGVPSVAPVRDAVESIRARWAEAGLAFELEAVGGGVRVVTRPEYAEYVGRLSRKPVSDKLSRALLETLCIVAYKQPVGRAEVERIRGVQAGEALRQLLDRRLLKVAGRSDQPGRPLLYGTTQEFLTAFGLDALEDLPQPQDLKRL